MTPLLRRIFMLTVAAGILLVVGIVIAVVVANLIRNSGATLTLAPAFSLCLVGPLFLSALVLSAVLYREQRRMASFWPVLWLAFLRLLLIVFLAVLLFQPALRWEHQRTSSGSLWVILDQSPSMQTADPQSSPVERLRWADALGLVTRRERFNDLAAQIHVLADELDGLTPDTGIIGAATDRTVVNTFADNVDKWIRKLDKFQTQLEDSQSSLNVFSKDAGTVAATAIGRARELAKTRVAAMRSATSLRDARNLLEAYSIGARLREAHEALKPAIQAADAANLERIKSSAEWTAANSRLASMPRADVAYEFLAANDARGSKLLLDLTKRYHLRVASFSDKAQSQGVVDQGSLHEALKTGLIASGQATDIAGALQYVAEQIPADEAASVILVTDGRNNLGSDPIGPARNLAARGIRVYGLLMGSHELSPDAAVEPVDFPDWIYAGDTIKPRALIRLDGLEGQTAQVELRRGGQLLDTRTMRATQAHQMVPFDFTDTPPESEKVIEYEIRIAPMAGEVNTQNNIAPFRVAVKKDKIYALVIEDGPRWEYRYLAAYLARRPGLKVQTMLLDPAVVTGVASPAPVMASPENPRIEAQVLPATLEQWQKFDIIVVGDVGPDVLTPQMQQYIAAAVRDKGATLITVAGKRYMPERYNGSVLADLLPVTLNPQYSAGELARHVRSGFLPETAPMAGTSVLAQLGADIGSNANAWRDMPVWYWHSAYTEGKPAASVIWEIGEQGGGGRRASGGAPGAAEGDARGSAGGTIERANRHALLSTMAIGLGRSLHLSADQTWRLRQVGGANLHDRFWGQVINWAVGSDLPAGGKYVRFGTNQPSYEQTQPVIVTARVLRDDLTPYTGLSFSAVARPVRGAGGGGAGEAPANTVEARFEPMESPGYYQATLSGLPIGDDEISLKGAEVERLLNGDPSVTLKTILIKVMPTMNAERRNMNTDPVMLETIAQAGGGFSVDGEHAEMLLSRLPEIERTEVSVLQVGFFTDSGAWGTQAAHWVFLALFVLVITVEWVWRKGAGLV